MNSLVNKNSGMAVKQPTFSEYITGEKISKTIMKMVGPDRSQSYVTAMISAVSNNVELAKCQFATIVSASLVGESLKLSPSPFMGHYYLVPYNDTKNNRVVAQFQIGYKGYIQLAMRTGQYKDIDVIEVKEGEYLGRNSETGKPMFKFISDDDERDSKKTIGYLAYFETTYGFTKTLYWTINQMKNHALEYSKGYKKDIERGTSYTFWSKNFTAMAVKTMIRQIISKWGIMSVDLETAFKNDQAYIDENDKAEFIDNPYEQVDLADENINTAKEITEQIIPTSTSEQPSLFDAIN